jgi:hypothetical protein
VVVEHMPWSEGKRPVTVAWTEFVGDKVSASGGSGV